MLSNYQYTLLIGSQNGNADGLIRLPLPKMLYQVPVPEEVVLAVLVLTKTPVSAAKIAQWTARDTTLCAVVGFVFMGWPVEVPETHKNYYSRREITMDDGCLLWGCRVIVPPPGSEQI